MKNFNQFNLKNRPFVNIGDFTGNDGNSFILAAKFRNGMKLAGYEEESEYLGGRSHSEYSNGKFDLLNMNRDFIENVVFSLAETNYEIEEKNKENDDDIVIVVKKKNKTPENESINYLGRGSHFYATVETMKDEVVKHYDEFLEKDKIGMTVLDHYLLSGKYSEYLLALQYIVINFTPEDYKNVFDNNVLGLKIIENMCEKNLLIMMHTNFAKYVLTKDESFIDETIENMNKELIKIDKSKSTEKEKVDLAKEVLNVMSISSYLAAQVEGTFDFTVKINSSLTEETSVFNKLVKSIKNKEFLAEFEKHILLSSMDTVRALEQSKDKSEELSNINIRRRI